MRRPQRLMSRLTYGAVLALLLLAVALPAAAQATTNNNGRGYYGATNDKVVTNAGFIVIAFFPLLIFALSMLQRRLDKRKQARKAAQKALGSPHWRGGW
jgi:hypothetical protein